MTLLFRIGLSTAIALAVVLRAIRSKSLNLPGALAAFVVGFVTMFSGFQFAAVLLVFFFSSSKLTKYGAKTKRTLVHEGESEGICLCSVVLKAFLFRICEKKKN
jgi:uncharacterized membrane protein